MKIADMKPGQTAYTQLDYQVLAVLSRRYDGWSMYVGAVAGNNHDVEWQAVAESGSKVKEPVAKAIAANYFFPGFDATGVEYAL